MTLHLQKVKRASLFSFSSRLASPPPQPHANNLGLLFCVSISAPTVVFSVFWLRLRVLMCHHLWLLFLSLAPSPTPGKTAKFFATLAVQGVYQIVFRLWGWPHKKFIFPSGSQLWEWDTDGWIFCQAMDLELVNTHGSPRQKFWGSGGGGWGEMFKVGSFSVWKRDTASTLDTSA